MLVAEMTFGITQDSCSLNRTCLRISISL